MTQRYNVVWQVAYIHKGEKKDQKFLIEIIGANQGKSL